MPLRFYIVDVFVVNDKFQGNQLAVFRGNPSTKIAQKIAAEMDYAETTFITSEEELNGGYNVRIFTNIHELPFAGHPTLGTAYVIRKELLKKNIPQFNLNLKVGPIPVTLKDEADIVWMHQDAPKFGIDYTQDKQVLAEILNINPDDFDNRFPIIEVSTGLSWIIAPLKSLQAVKGIDAISKFDLSKFEALIRKRENEKNSLKAEGIMVFCPETEYKDNQIHARAFCHLHGMPEDAATGSANGDLAGYLSRYKYFGSSDIDTRVEQGYEMRRPSLIFVKANFHEQDQNIKVNVGGKVVMVASGEFYVD